MRRSDFHFELPRAQIAQHPAPERSQSRLLCLDGHSGDLQDRRFHDLPAMLTAGDLLVFNDTRVIPARLFGVKQSGGKVEVLIERVLDEHRVLAYVRAGKPPLPGSWLALKRRFPPGYELLDPDICSSRIPVEVLARQGELFELYFNTKLQAYEIINSAGEIPLPPYITRCPNRQDSERYQTVYARHPGAVAAPTAGLHFDRALLNELSAGGVGSAFITLHIGAGTFQPMRVEEISEHKMHSEYLEVSQQVCEQVRATRVRGGRVIAVGTTSVRALEAASQKGNIQPFCGETSIFITPGYRFRSVDALVTNFHLPESTLLVLVCAFAGKQQVLAAYRHAVANGYRFFSYGDAMFILPEAYKTEFVA